MAERGGFEPPTTFWAVLAFQASSLSRSVTSPHVPLAHPCLAKRGHLGGELLKVMAGIDMIHVPYKGSAPAMTDFLGGRISMMFDTTSNFVDHVKTGKLRALGVTGRKRSPALPAVPSISESAGMAAYDMTLWLGVLAPAGTPKDLVARLHRELDAVMASPEIVKQMADAGIEVRVSTPGEFSALIRADMAKWATVVKRAGLQAE